MILLSPWVLVGVAVLIVALGIVAFVAISRARRLDRLHQRIIASRDALSRLLLRRASEASLLTQCAAFEEGSADAMRDLARAYIHDGGDQLTTDGLDRRTTAGAIRDTLTPPVRESIGADPLAAARLEALDATCYRIQLTRNVHNVDVAGVRALRSARMVKLLRLAGRAPIPEPIDFDDDTHTGGRGY